MNNTPKTGGRKKKVTEGNGNVAKHDSVNTSGPVGREDGYAGRDDGNKTEIENAHTNAAGDQEDKGLGTQIIGSLLTGGGNQSSNNSGSILGSLLGGSSGQSSNQSSNNSGSILGSLLGGTSGSSGSSSGSSSSGGSGLFGGSSGGSNNRGGSKLGKLLLIILLAVVAIWLFKKCSGGQACSLMDMMSGMTGSDNIAAFVPETGYDTYDAADAEAPTAVSASTSVSTADITVAPSARDKRTVIKGDGTDEVLIMLYMCGTDLESKYGMATNDLNEILHGTIDPDKVHIVVETGGTKTWKNSVISNTTNQRYLITNKGLTALDKNLGQKSMVDPNTLTDFIKFCKSKYPKANRNILIFWDHGGGSLSGYGYDQYFNGSMTLDKINKALKNAGVTFDFIGFDACLMATMETALVTEQYADYLIGSEETEPGCGWYYSNWITAISRNPAISTVELGKIIIDDFNDVCQKNNAGDSTTLSITDLAEFAGTVPDAFGKFATSINRLLDSQEYDTVAKARSRAREFGASAGINHVDLIHLASGIGTTEAQNLITALKGCIKYNRSSRSMTNSYGMSIYFPYTSFKSVGTAVSLYNSIGMDENYSACLKSFASLAAGGQIATGTTSSPMDSLFGSFTGTSSSSSSSSVLSSLLGSYLGGGSSGGSSSGSLLGSILGGGDTSWFDSGRVMNNLDYYDSHVIYSDDMLLTDKDGGKVLSLTPEKWEMIETVQLNVFVDDGEGFIDLGMDNVYEFDDDGDLIIDYDRTWLALDGQVVPYYMMSDVTDAGVRVITGRVPAELNGELVYIIIVFDESDPATEYGYVVGARNIYDEDDPMARGLIEIKDGDRISFICDYYRYDGTYKESCLFGETITVNGPIEVSNVSIGSLPCRVTYCLTDIYANEFWTESVEY